MERVTTGLVEWASASRPLADGEASGDALWVRVRPESAMIVAVDGLGHGPAAAAAAQQAMALLAEADRDYPLRTLRRCHEGLRGTRGVVLSLAWFDAERGSMTWMGVGNIAGVLLRADPKANPRQESLSLRGGVVGRQLPLLHASIVPVSPGDQVILATDGVRPAFTLSLDGRLAPQPLADRILAEHRTGNDDALVVVARYRGDEA